MNFKFIHIVFFGVMVHAVALCQQSERHSNWTWLHTKRFTQQEITLNGSRDNLVFSKQASSDWQFFETACRYF